MPSHLSRLPVPLRGALKKKKRCHTRPRVFYRVNRKREGQVSIRGKYRKTVGEATFFGYYLDKLEVEFQFEYDGNRYSLVGQCPERRKLGRVGEVVTAKQWSICPVTEDGDEVPDAISVVVFGERE